MMKTFTPSLPWFLLLVASQLGACSCGGRLPLPAHLELTNGLAELRERMTAAKPAVTKYSAEVRMTYFGPQGRVKGSAILAVSRPSSMRYDVMAPHGAVLEAFATNGEQMQLLLPNEQLFLFGSASADNIDKLMRLAPLHRDAQGWVTMLFGEVDPPAHARLVYDDQRGRFLLTWEEGGYALTVEIDPESSRVVRAAMAKGGAMVSEVEITGRDDKGIPSALAMRAPGAGADGADVDVRIALRDLEYDSSALSPSDFVLHPPRGFNQQHLDALLPVGEAPAAPSASDDTDRKAAATPAPAPAEDAATTAEETSAETDNAALGEAEAPVAP